MKKHSITEIIVTLAIIAVIIVSHKHFNLMENVAELRAFLAHFGFFAPVIFGLICIIGSLLFFPISGFGILGSLIFEATEAFIILLISYTLGSVLCFVIGHRFSTLIPKFRGGHIKKFRDYLERRIAEHTFGTILALHMMYMNFTVVSYSAGLAKKCRFWPFVFATFLADVFYVGAFVYFGDQLNQGLSKMLIPAIIVVFILCIPYVLHKIAGKKSAKMR